MHANGIEPQECLRSEGLDKSFDVNAIGDMLINNPCSTEVELEWTDEDVVSEEEKERVRLEEMGQIG